MLSSRIAKASRLMILLLLASPKLFAQFNSGLEGTVFDPSGAAVPTASVVLKEVNTGVVHTTVTSTAGFYRFTSLPASAFTLEVKAAGFQTAVLTDISIQVAETRTLNVNLKLGATAQEVSVTAAVTPVNLSTGAVSGQINETKVHELPLVGRNMYSLVVLTPGVTGLPSGGGQAYAQATADIFNAELAPNLNANGARTESNNFMVDGATTSGNPRGGVTNLTPNADSIQEVRIETNNFSAEFGRNASSLVNVETKSGTNDYHGTMSWFHTDTHLNSRTIYQPEAPQFIRNEFAWSLGGPIRKDKDFAFGSMDFLRSGVGTAFQSTIFTPQFITYLQQNAPNNISTKLLTEFPTKFEPNRGFVNVGADLGNGGTAVDCTTLPSPATPIPTPLGNVPCNLNVIGTGDFSTTIFRNGIQWSARVDHNWNNFKDRLYGSFYRTTRQTVIFASPSVYFPAFSPAEPEYTHLLNLNWTHSAGPSLVNEMRASYTRTFGNAPCDHCEVPSITINDGTAGPGNGFFGLFRQNNYEWKDVATLTRGRHTLKFGGNVARHHDDENFGGTTERPTFTFFNALYFAADNPFFEGNIGFDPRTGKVGGVNVDLAYRDSDLGAFLQDDFKMRPNLTLNMGLRWETFTSPTEKFDRLDNISFQGGSTYQERIANAAMEPVASLWHTRMDDFGPRFAFAWDPTKKGKMSVRGGWGIFFDRPSNQFFTGGANLPYFASASASIFTPPTVPVYGLGTSGQPPFGFPPVTTITPGLDAKNGLLSGKADQHTVDPNLAVQYAENWSFGVQYQVFKDWVAEADYIGSVGHHLYAAYDVNRFAGDLIQNKGVLTRLNTSFGALGYGQSNLNSAYNGATLSVRNRGFTKGINFQAAYTLGKAIDQQSSLGTGLPIIDITNLRAERGLSDFDIRQRLAFSTLWQVPHIATQSRWANAILNGWQISNITILQAGSPFTVFCSASFSPVFDASGNVIGNTGCDYNADGESYDVPMPASFGNAKNGLSRSAFIRGIFDCTTSFCGNVFPAPPLGQEGSLGRNTFIGPGYANTDFSATKRTHIPWFVGAEGAQMEIRAEFFNAFNRVNVSGVTWDLSSSTFGQASSTFPARDIQFGLRIEF